MWLLDTNIIIKVPAKIRAKFSSDQIKCSYITVLEHPIATKYTNIEVIYPNKEIWNQNLLLAIRLRNLGQILPIPDLIIGSTAIVTNITLVSDDQHFKLIHSINPALMTISQQEFETYLQEAV